MKTNNSTNEFYFQLFETPINYNLIRKLALGPQGSALRGGYCYIPEFRTLILIFLLIYDYDFILYHMITYLCSRT